MRREDFTIDGIPDGYQVYFADLTQAGHPMAVLGSIEDEWAPAFARVGDIQMPLPDGTILRLRDGTMWLGSIARPVGEDRILFVGGNPTPGGGDAYGQILSQSGTPGPKFAMGQPRDVLSNADWIVATYSDQAIFGDVPLSKEGLTVFDSSGSFKWGHATTFDYTPHIAHVYAACWAGADKLAFFPYYEFAAVLLDLRNATQHTWETPASTHHSNAMAWSDQAVYFHASLTYPRPPRQSLLDTLRDKLHLTKPDHPVATEVARVESGDIVSWKPGTNDWEVVGTFDGYLRGLPGGRFIAPKPDGYTILSSTDRLPGVSLIPRLEKPR